MKSYGEIIDSHKDTEGSLLPILHDIQHEYGYIPDEAIAPISDALLLSKAEVYGVISFYHDFKTTPSGQKVLKICRAEACQSMGAESIIADVLSAFGLNDFGTTQDGKISIEAVYCLGLCATSPAALLDNQPLAKINATTISEALK